MRAGIRQRSRIAEKDEWSVTRVLATNGRANGYDSGIGVGFQTSRLCEKGCSKRSDGFVTNEKHHE